ncbi:MAG: F0F1 ATP synthase subunit B [Parvularculaceae bacterium]|nr:F0F1 ATP synthase subunit B [Parvularculaceae bacterium]
MIDVLLMFASAASEAAHGGGHEAVPLWQDTSAWVSLGFVLVVGLFAYLGVHKSISTALDKRSQSIADELDRARALRDEAQELLAKYQRRQREAEEEAQGIIEQAKKDAHNIAAEARQKIEEQLSRRAKAAEDKIARAESQALAEVRNQTTDLAVDTAREIIRGRMDQGAQSALAEKAIDELRAKFH